MDRALPHFQPFGIPVNLGGDCGRLHFVAFEFSMYFLGSLYSSNVFSRWQGVFLLLLFFFNNPMHIFLYKTQNIELSCTESYETYMKGKSTCFSRRLLAVFSRTKTKVVFIGIIARLMTYVITHLVEIIGISEAIQTNTSRVCTPCPTICFYSN